MAAPVVQSVNDIINELKPATQGQSDLIDQQISQNDAYGQTQIAALDAKKTKGFADIEQNAQNKGMYFSGFSPDQQASYLSDTYLPAVASVQKSILDTRNSLLGQKNSLFSDLFGKAYDTNQTQQGRLFDYNQQQDSFAFQSSEAEKDRAFQAQQAAAAAAVKYATSGSGSSSKAATDSAKFGLQDDIVAAFSQAGSKDKNYTERVVLPQLYSAYADLGNDAVNKAVYQYRKNALGY